MVRLGPVLRTSLRFNLAKSSSRVASQEVSRRKVQPIGAKKDND